MPSSNRQGKGPSSSLPQGRGPKSDSLFLCYSDPTTSGAASHPAPWTSSRPRPAPMASRECVKPRCPSRAASGQESQGKRRPSQECGWSMSGAREPSAARPSPTGSTGKPPRLASPAQAAHPTTTCDEAITSCPAGGWSRGGSSRVRHRWRCLQLAGPCHTRWKTAGPRRSDG